MIDIKSLNKKELGYIKAVLIKLSKVFDSCSILNTGDVLSPNELEFVYVRFKNAYMDIMSQFFDKSSPMIYIPSINDLKSAIQSYIDNEKSPDEQPDINELYEVVTPGSGLYVKTMDMLEDYESHTHKLNFSRLTYTEDRLTILFDENMTFETPLKLGEKNLHITTGKCMFPYCNKSNLNKYMYYDTIVYFGDDIYQFNLYCDMPEMDVYTAYRFI